MTVHKRVKDGTTYLEFPFPEHEIAFGLVCVQDVAMDLRKGGSRRSRTGGE
jgi:hypothetical protein